MRHQDRRDQGRSSDETGVAVRPQFADPPPQRTAFGASTVGGAVAASALAGPDRAGEPEVSDEDTVAPGDGEIETHADIETRGTGGRRT